MTTDYKPHIGKNVIETLTLGMYEDARFIFREYVQNAADQIDEAIELDILDSRDNGKIKIYLSKEKKSIIIEDNATGIKKKQVLRFLGDVAASSKDRTKRKGFRGIGRLGGLGYCEKLIFETSYRGESEKSIMTLDAKQLRDVISDKENSSDAASVISFITTLETFDEEPSLHYFKVILEDVTNNNLLDIDDVREYLSMVAPVRFSDKFPFKEKIHTHFKKNNLILDEYNVTLNNELISKAYKTYLFDKNGETEPKIRFLDVRFFDIRSRLGELLALGWYGVTNKLNFKIHSNNIEAGIRLRKHNIAIGSNETLSPFFGQSRQNLNYIGELHVNGPQFIPNARRDYFNDNYTTKILEEELRNFFPSLGSLTQNTSKLHNRTKDINKYKEAAKKFNQESKEYTSHREREEIGKLKKLEKKANDAIKTIKKIEEKTNTNQGLKIIFNDIVDLEVYNLPSVKSIVEKKEPKPPLVESLKLKGNEKKIVEEIFKILEERLPTNQAEEVKKIIAERFS